MLINVLRVHVRRMGPDSFQWCPVTGQGATGTNRSIGSSIWTWGRTSSLEAWWSTGTGCPGRLWSLLLWRYSKPSWMQSPVQPALGGLTLAGLDDPQRPLPDPTTLWLCDTCLALNQCNSVKQVQLNYLTLQRLLLFCVHMSFLNVL